MHTQTVERQELYKMIDALPDDSVVTAIDLIRSLRSSEEWVDPIEVGTPNAETLEAIRELNEGGGITFESPEELFKYLDS